MYTRIVSRLLFPLHERLKGHDTVARLARLEESQWWEPERIAELQGRNLRRFLVEIGRHVPYFRERFAELGFRPERVTGAADLAALPPMDKEAVRAAGDRLRSERAGRLSRFNTGGSSGEPLIFYLGERVSHDVAAKWRATRWWGVEIGDPEVVLWGSPIERSKQDWVREARDRLLRTRLLPAFEMSPANQDRFLEVIRRVRPRQLFGYPSAFALLAERARARGVAMDDLGIRVVFCTSERLYDHQRQAIEACFHAPVANGYGARDAGFLAHACPEGGLHLSAEDVVVEVVDPESGRPLGPGELGEIVVTHTATTDYPFVRYRTGDLGRLAAGRCPCGRGLPCLAEVEGRATDFVVAADGTVMHGLALIYILRDMPEVARFRIHQESRERTRVQVVARDGWSEGLTRRVVEGFRARLGPEVEVAVEVVEAIPPEASGKFRYVV
ncbi:MAG: phenylacetate--CoA ligase family protein, partial [Nitrospirae bacterium]